MVQELMDKDETRDNETLCGYVLAHLWAFSKDFYFFIFGFLTYRICILHLDGALFLYMIGSPVILLNILKVASIYYLQVADLRRSGLRRMSSGQVAIRGMLAQHKLRSR